MTAAPRSGIVIAALGATLGCAPAALPPSFAAAESGIYTLAATTLASDCPADVLGHLSRRATLAVRDELHAQVDLETIRLDGVDAGAALLKFELGSDDPSRTLTIDCRESNRTQRVTPLLSRVDGDVVQLDVSYEYARGIDCQAPECTVHQRLDLTLEVQCSLDCALDGLRFGESSCCAEPE